MTEAAPIESDRARELTVNAGLVRILLQTLEERGVSRASLLRASGLDADQITDSQNRIAVAKVCAMCELALNSTGDMAIGLHFGERLHGAALGMLAHLVAHASTLRCGLGALLQFERLVSDHSLYELTERDGRAVLRCCWLPSQEPMRHFIAEVTTSHIFHLLRDCDLHAVRIHFEYDAPAHRNAYKHFFASEVHFRQPFTGLSFDCALLDHPAPHRDDEVYAVLEALADRRLLRLKESKPFAARVRDILVDGVPPRDTDMPTVARALGLSARSLRRRLASEGKPYNVVAKEAMVMVAKNMLRSKRRNWEVAQALGFSDTPSFHRAFKRWTGQTPSRYRLGTLAAERAPSASDTSTPTCS
ncbi:MAG: AraC family transcriptional regulator [Polyangiales bacterium]